MGVPCVNVPVPGQRLPVGVQVIGRFGDDGRALAVARMIEDAAARASDGPRGSLVGARPSELNAGGPFVRCASRERDPPRRAAPAAP